MDFELSDDQEALRDAARSLLDGRSSPTQVRAVVDAGGGIDDGLWSAMVDQGWSALAVNRWWPQGSADGGTIPGVWTCSSRMTLV